MKPTYFAILKEQVSLNPEKVVFQITDSYNHFLKRIADWG